tara:strand:- start:45 stop:1142 length:1098 start_codon:yes stop_codon:yes gene_type:complete
MKPNLLTPGVWYQIAPGISICLMDTKDFLKLPEWITQRNTVNRLKKRGVLDHLRKLFPTHIIVAVGELTKDDVWEDNTKYSAGHQWRLDANTRARAWQEGKTDKVPDNVLAVKYDEDTLIGLRNIYWAFDNPSATEQTAEICQGIFKSLRYFPVTKKFQDGAIVTALSYTCQYHDPDTFGKRGLWTDTDDESITLDEYRRSQTLCAVHTYMDNIKAVDKLLSQTGYNKQFDATFMTALFLFHIQKGPFNSNVTQLLSLIAETALDEDGEIIGIPVVGKGRVNAATWIARENGRNHDIVIKDRGKMDGFSQGVPFFLYWLNIAYEKGLNHKQNQGPNGGYEKWFTTFMAADDHKTLMHKVEQQIAA